MFKEKSLSFLTQDFVKEPENFSTADSSCQPSNHRYAHLKTSEQTKQTFGRKVYVVLLFFETILCHRVIIIFLFSITTYRNTQRRR